MNKRQAERDAQDAQWAREREERRRRSAAWRLRKQERDAALLALPWAERYPPMYFQQMTSRARAYGVPGVVTLAEWTRLCETCGMICVRCGTADCVLVADHVVSMSRGGPNGISNIQPLCFECNSIKNHLPGDYRPKGEKRPPRRPASEETP